MVLGQIKAKSQSQNYEKKEVKATNWSKAEREREKSQLLLGNKVTTVGQQLNGLNGSNDLYNNFENKSNSTSLLCKKWSMHRTNLK